MSSEYFFSFDIKPQAQQRARASKFGFYIPKETVAFKKELVRQIKDQYMGKVLDSPLSIDIVFSFKKPKTVKREIHSVKPDLDNLVKSFLDAFNGIIWKDDALIHEMHIRKVYSDNDKIGLHVFTL